MSVHASAITAQTDLAHEAASANHAELIDHLRSLASKFLTQRLNSFQDEAEQFLFNLAGNTQDEDLHTLYLDTISRLRNKREAIKVDTVERFIQLTKDPEARTVSLTTTSANIDKLLLNGDDDLESSLAIKHLITHACERHAVNLEALEDVHAQLCGNTVPNPLSPTLFCIAWKESIDKLKVPLDTKTIAYKLFTKFVVNHLGNLYDRALSELSMQGISSRVRRTSATAPTAHNAAAPPRKSELDPEALTRELVVKRGVEILKSDTTRQGPDARDRALIDTLTLLQGYLDVLQPVTPNQRPGREAADMVHLFSRLAQVAYGDTFRTRDRELIDAVRGLINPLLDDDRIDARARILIARLQIPALKVAFLDAEFISESQHPLRVLLHNISTLTHISDEPGSDFAKARHTVSRIVSELRQDINVLDIILPSAGFGPKPSAQMPTSVAGATSVHIQIEKSIKGRRVPDTVRSFIDTAWTEVMNKVAATDGLGSEPFVAGLKTIDDLVTVVQAHDYAAHHEKVMETIPGLLCRLQNGLSLITCDRTTKDQLFNQLITAHARSIHFKKSNSKRAPVKPTK